MQSSERRIICQRAHWRIELHMCPKDNYAKLEFAEVRMTKWEVRSFEVRRALARGILSPEGGSQ